MRNQCRFLGNVKNYEIFAAKGLFVKCRFSKRLIADILHENGENMQKKCKTNEYTLFRAQINGKYTIYLQY